MKIAVFGGAFNPVHNGHIALLKSFDDKLHFDKILIIPTKESPHKLSVGLIDFGYRASMCRLAFSGFEKAEVSDIEYRREGKSYTVDTLRRLEKLYPDDELYLICGSDMFMTLQNWREPKEIFKRAVICGAKRGDDELDEMMEQDAKLRKMGAKTLLSYVFIPPYSSTEVRKAIKYSEDCDDMLNERVHDYIKRFGLYLPPQRQEKILQKMFVKYTALIKKRENEKRFVHSCNVAKKAKELAAKYGADENRAYLAGLLHDICKNDTKENTLKLFKKFGIILDNVSEQSPKLWHAIAGAAYVKNVLKLDDYEIEDAIRYHTTGRANASLLEKIVYLADFVSDERDFDGVDKIRESFDGGLENALFCASKFTVNTLCEENLPIHPDSIAAYNEIALKRLKTD